MHVTPLIGSYQRLLSSFWSCWSFASICRYSFMHSPMHRASNDNFMTQKKILKHRIQKGIQLEYKKEPVSKAKWIKGKSLIPAHSWKKNHNFVASWFCTLVAHINYKRSPAIYQEVYQWPTMSTVISIGSNNFLIQQLGGTGTVWFYCHLSNESEYLIKPP